MHHPQNLPELLWEIMEAVVQWQIYWVLGRGGGCFWEILSLPCSRPNWSRILQDCLHIKASPCFTGILLCFLANKHAFHLMSSGSKAIENVTHICRKCPAAYSAHSCVGCWACQSFSQFCCHIPCLIFHSSQKSRVRWILSNQGISFLISVRNFHIRALSIWSWREIYAYSWLVLYSVSCCWFSIIWCGHSCILTMDAFTGANDPVLCQGAVHKSAQLLPALLRCVSPFCITVTCAFIHWNTSFLQCPSAATMKSTEWLQ